MKVGILMGMSVAAVIGVAVGMQLGQRNAPARLSPSGRPELVEGRMQVSVPMAPPAAEDLKLWTRHQALLAEFKFPDPKELEKLSEEKRQAKMQEAQEALREHEEKILLKLHEEFPGMKATDIPLTLRKVQEFIAVITPRYYKLQEQEVARLQAAGAFSEASLPLIRLQALQELAQEFPAVGESEIKQLLGLRE